MLELFAMYLVGVFMGYILAKVLSRPKAIGSIVIDRSDVDGPYLFLELSESIDAFSDKKQVCVEIKNVDFLSHN
jgi:hypothetical protein